MEFFCLASTVVAYRNKLKLTLSGMLILTCALASASCTHTSGKPATERPNAAPVKVILISVERQEQRRTVEAVGSLFAYDEVTVSSEAEGRVEEVLADVGDRVTKGQVLARISPTELELTVEQQRAALQQARARLGLREEDGELKDVRQAAEVK